MLSNMDYDEFITHIEASQKRNLDFRTCEANFQKMSLRKFQRILEALSKNPHIKAVYMDGCSLGTQPDKLLTLTGFIEQEQDIHLFSLSDNNLGSADFAVLEPLFLALAANPTIKTLYLNRNLLGGSSACLQALTLFLVKNKRLTTLYLSEVGLGTSKHINDKIRLINSIHEHPTLQDLCLSFNGLGKSSLGLRLMNKLVLSPLRHMNLAFNELQDVGSQLAAYAYNVTCERLNLQGNFLINNDDVMKFAAITNRNNKFHQNLRLAKKQQKTAYDSLSEAMKESFSDLSEYFRYYLKPFKMLDKILDEISAIDEVVEAQYLACLSYVGRGRLYLAAKLKTKAFEYFKLGIRHLLKVPEKELVKSEYYHRFLSSLLLEIAIKFGKKSLKRFSQALSISCSLRHPYYPKLQRCAIGQFSKKEFITERLVFDLTKMKTEVNTLSIIEDLNYLVKKLGSKDEIIDGFFTRSIERLQVNKNSLASPVELLKILRKHELKVFNQLVKNIQLLQRELKLAPHSESYMMAINELIGEEQVSRLGLYSSKSILMPTPSSPAQDKNRRVLTRPFSTVSQ